TMHDAYERIDLTASPYGLFMAGPSATRGIQGVIIHGAQGARSRTVLLLPPAGGGGEAPLATCEYQPPPPFLDRRQCMSRTVAEDLVDTLARAGVQRIYGIVGDSLNPVTDALRRSNKIRWVDVRHEETAAFAAGAEAQLTGRLAVCAGSCGPGNLHLINGLYDAHRSMAPVLAIAAHIPSSEIGTGYFQETHPEQFFRECSHYCELISRSRQAPRVLQSALQHAVSERGVSVIVLPGDVAALEAPANNFTQGAVRARPVVRPADDDLARLADLLNRGRRVALFCGIGCAGAHDAAVTLAEKLQATVGA